MLAVDGKRHSPQVVVAEGGRRPLPVVLPEVGRRPLPVPTAEDGHHTLSVPTAEGGHHTLPVLAAGVINQVPRPVEHRRALITPTFTPTRRSGAASASCG